MPSWQRGCALFPYTTLFRSRDDVQHAAGYAGGERRGDSEHPGLRSAQVLYRSEEHTSELQSLSHLVCRLGSGDVHSFPTRRSSDLGTTCNTPQDMPAASDVAILSILGYDPHKYYTDRKSTRLNSSHLAISYAVLAAGMCTLSLHDALPISGRRATRRRICRRRATWRF